MKDQYTENSALKSENRFVKAIKNSVIVSALDSFFLWLYAKIKIGFFSRIITGSYDNSIGKVDIKEPKPRNRLIRNLSLKIENSKIVNAVVRRAEAFKYLKLKIFGVFLMSIAIYTVLFSTIGSLLSGSILKKYPFYVSIIESSVVLVVSLFFVFSDKTFAYVISSSGILRKVFDFIGFDVSKFDNDRKTGKYLPAFIWGLVFGIIGSLTEPFLLFAGLFALFAVYYILCVPETGAVLLFFMMPFMPTMVLAAFSIFVFFSFLVKVIRGKRVIRTDRIDIVVFIFAFVLLFGGFVSFSTGSIAPALMFVCFLSGYFVVSCAIREKKWINKCIFALIVSSVLVALYGIYGYFFGSAMAKAWIDAFMFEGISSRAVSTLDNPNMLGEYLIMILPIILSSVFTKSFMRRKYSIGAFLILGACLVLTWSRGAWIAFFLSIILFLLIWNARSIWIFLAGIVSLPVLTMVLPNSVMGRLTSIGNLADSSTSYRVGIWRGSMHIFKDYILTGIGIGESAWDKIYPEYTIPGIEKAPHSHNLFLQIGIETGIIGLLVFLIIIFLLVRMTFRSYKTISSDINGKYSYEDFAYKMTLAGPFCGIFAVLIQGFTDYSWYNYRVYLMFWLVTALIPAIVKNRYDSINKKQNMIKNYDDPSTFNIDLRFIK